MGKRSKLWGTLRMRRVQVLDAGCRVLDAGHRGVSGIL